MLKQQTPRRPQGLRLPPPSPTVSPHLLWSVQRAESEQKRANRDGGPSSESNSDTDPEGLKQHVAADGYFFSKVHYKLHSAVFFMSNIKTIPGGEFVGEPQAGFCDPRSSFFGFLYCFFTKAV